MNIQGIRANYISPKRNNFRVWPPTLWRQFYIHKERIMNKCTNFIASATKRFVADERGNDAVEYGLILGLVSLAIAGVAGTVGTDLNTLFTSAGTALGNAVTAAGG
jgi:pilus assembly protein Flp/PilA